MYNVGKTGTFLFEVGTKTKTLTKYKCTIIKESEASYGIRFKNNKGYTIKKHNVPKRKVVDIGVLV